MTGPAVEKLKQAEQYKEDGNRFFKDGQMKRALGAYHKVFCYVNGLQVPGAEKNDISDSTPADGSVNRNRLPKENVEDLRKLKQSTRLNMAACYLKLGEHQKCIDACSTALTFGNSSKAYYRRAQAYSELRNIAAAKADLDRALELTPDDRSIQVEMRKLKTDSVKADDEEKKRCAKMFPKEEEPASLTSEPKPKIEAGAPPSKGKEGLEHGGGHGHSQGHAHDDHDEAGGCCQGHQHEPDHGHDHGHGHGHAASTGSAPAAPGAGRVGGGDCGSQGLMAPPAPKPSTASGTVVQPHTELVDDTRRPDVAVRELTYAWQQTEDDVKIYIPFDQSEELSRGVDESRVKVEFGEWNFLLVIESGGKGKAPLGLRLGDFHRRLAPEKCTCTVRSSRITLKLVKQAKERWWNLLQNAPLHAD